MKVTDLFPQGLVIPIAAGVSVVAALALLWFGGRFDDPEKLVGAVAGAGVATLVMSLDDGLTTVQSTLLIVVLIGLVAGLVRYRERLLTPVRGS